MANAAQRLSQMQSVYYYFLVWAEKMRQRQCLDKVLHKLVKQIRNEDLRQDKTTFGIVDAQSVQMLTQGKKKGMTREKSIWNQTPRCRRYDGAAACHSRNNADAD